MRDLTLGDKIDPNPGKVGGNDFWMLVVKEALLENDPPGQRTQALAMDVEIDPPGQRTQALAMDLDSRPPEQRIKAWAMDSDNGLLGQ